MQIFPWIQSLLKLTQYTLILPNMSTNWTYRSLILQNNILGRRHRNYFDICSLIGFLGITDYENYYSFIQTQFEDRMVELNNKLKYLVVSKPHQLESINLFQFTNYLFINL